MSENLSQKIINTVCYYDVLNYPLTLFEIWKHIIRNDKGDGDEKCALSDIFLEFEHNNKLRAFIKNKQGFYFLRGRDNLVKERVLKDKISVSKIKKLQKTISLLRFCPYVRMILVTGRLAMKNAKHKSDWDVLVVLKSGKIWSGRTIITIVTHLIGKRRYGKKTKDRVCFNYFVTTKSLKIRNKDLFSANEYFFAIPIFDTGKYFKKFQLKNNWISKYKQNYYLTGNEHLKRVEDGFFTNKIRLFLEKVVDFKWLEKYLRKIELKKIKNNPKTRKENSFINADDEALIFLPNPQGPKIFEKFKNKISAL